MRLTEVTDSDDLTYEARLLAGDIDTLSGTMFEELLGPLDYLEGLSDKRKQTLQYSEAQLGELKRAFNEIFEYAEELGPEPYQAFLRFVSQSWREYANSDRGEDFPKIKQQELTVVTDLIRKSEQIH